MGIVRSYWADLFAPVLFRARSSVVNWWFQQSYCDRKSRNRTCTLVQFCVVCPLLALHIGGMKDYHRIWVESHRLATIEFLEQALAAGFDIHHADGDRRNNSPDNLVLIYSGDHAKLHAGIKIMGERAARDHEAKVTKGREAYAARSSGESWRSIAVRIGACALNLAKRHAEAHGLAWPVPVPRAAPARPRRVQHHARLAGHLTPEELRNEERFREVLCRLNPLMPGDLNKVIGI